MKNLVITNKKLENQISIINNINEHYKVTELDNQIKS